jgi:archaellum biogenesis ATPase FlaH
VFDDIVKFVNKYNKLPTAETLLIELDTSSNYEEAKTLLKADVDAVEKDWLVDRTEGWCQDRALHLAVMDSIEIINGTHKELSKDAMPDLLTKALAVTFDSSVGHDYIDDAEGRFEFYNATEERIPYDLTYFNQITKGGLPRKSLSVILAGTGVGKSLFMCHQAAAAMSMGKNVLYITCEMAEEKIAERIDANLLNVDIAKLDTLEHDNFINKVNKISTKTQGKIIIKEYPTATAHTGHFRALLSEIKLKRKMVPDIIFIDYLNICASARMKGMGGSINSYTYIKSIAEEIRGLAVEFNVPIVTATQVNREGFDSSDVDLTNTSESFGLPATADLMFALISNEELEGLNQIMVKQLKNRYNDIGLNKRFVIGVDRAKMRLFDVEERAQSLIESPKKEDPLNLPDKFTGFK